MNTAIKATTRVGAVLFAALVSFSGMSQAATWPDKPVHIVVPYSAGGTTDFIARLIAQKVGEETGGTFVVENKTGGGGTIGAAYVARAKPDGTTFMTNDTAYAMLPALFKKLSWDHEHDLIPVTTLISTPVVLAVPANSRFKTLKALQDYAKANPGKLNFGTGGVGSSAHLQAVLFNSEAGIQATHVPYKGAGEAMVSLVGGQVDYLISASPTAIPQVNGGKVRALAITGDARIDPLKDTPTFAEAGLPEYTVMNWFGFAAPKGTDPSIIDKLYHAVKQALTDPDIKQRLASQGAIPGGATPEAFKALIQKEVKVWAAAAQGAGIQPQ